MAFTNMTLPRTASVAGPTGKASEAVRAPCSSRPEVKPKASPLKKALRKPLRCVKAAAASFAAKVQPKVKEPTLEVHITDLLHPAAFHLAANPLDLDITFRRPSRAWALACAKKGGRLPGRWEVELEERLLAVRNYGTGLLQQVPDHLAFQWAAADALMACRTPTELAHAIAARFPHSTYAEMVQPEQRKPPSPTAAPAAAPADNIQEPSPALEYAASTRHVSICPITFSVRTLDYVPLTRSISSCQSSPSAPPTPQQSANSPPGSPQQSSCSPPPTPQRATSNSPATPQHTSTSPPTTPHSTSSPPATPQQSSCSPAATPQPTDSHRQPCAGSSPSSIASQASASMRSTPQWRQRTASGLEVDVSPVPWGSRSRFAEMRAGGCISPPAAHPSFYGRRPAFLPACESAAPDRMM